MRIACPNCTASYEVVAAAIGAAGRSVRCVRCRSVWFQRPETEVPPLAMAVPTAAPEPAGDAAVAAFETELGVDAAPADEEPPPAGAGEPSLDDLMRVEAPAVTDEAAPEVEAPHVALSDITIPTHAAPDAVPPDAQPPAGADPADAAGDIESFAARHSRRSAARRRIPMRRPGALPAVALLLAGVVAALIVWRGPVVRHAPQMASLYAAIGLPVNLRGLAFTAVNVARDAHEGVPVLVVEGTIASVASRPVEVPRLRFAMRNEAGGEVYAWTAMPTRETLGPGETMPFRSRLAAPPGEARDVTVRFFTRHDAAAGGR